MGKDVNFKNRDRLIQIGIAISTLRKIRGLSQEQLAEKVGISRSLLSLIEAPNVAHSFSLDVFFDIADALDIQPDKLILPSIFPDTMLCNV
ncbi:MAG: helix-turn-helix transcriptional regulator [Oscillospiraceae bacterium]|nr:helix-turn-helix transcriptional regulator [Oscillospiraceae bacterium]